MGTFSTPHPRAQELDQQGSIVFSIQAALDPFVVDYGYAHSAYYCLQLSKYTLFSIAFLRIVTLIYSNPAHTAIK